jgi:glycerol uptake facilitator-like aquaporin
MGYAKIYINYEYFKKSKVPAISTNIFRSQRTQPTSYGSVILVIVYTKGLRGYSELVIGGIVGLDIFFLAFISGTSMNPARSLAPATTSGVIGNLWLYWSATFIGTSIVAFLLRKKLAG